MRRISRLHIIHILHQITFQDQIKDQEKQLELQISLNLAHDSLRVPEAPQMMGDEDSMTDDAFVKIRKF